MQPRAPTKKRGRCHVSQLPVLILFLCSRRLSQEEVLCYSPGATPLHRMVARNTNMSRCRVFTTLHNATGTALEKLLALAAPLLTCKQKETAHRFAFAGIVCILSNELLYAWFFFQICSCIFSSPSVVTYAFRTTHLRSSVCFVYTSHLKTHTIHSEFTSL